MEANHELKMKFAELLAALKRYGEHEPDCGLYADGELYGEPANTTCTCGLEAAIERAERSKKK